MANCYTQSILIIFKVKHNNALLNETQVDV